jgi:hypothetical protein
MICDGASTALNAFADKPAADSGARCCTAQRMDASRDTDNATKSAGGALLPAQAMRARWVHGVRHDR